MDVEIPKELKADIPQTTWGKILTATPVVMAVVSTMLAGLSTSEMTSAQYDRSFGAQQQSKAGDQWNFYQAKRLRGASQQTSFELLQSLADTRPLEVTALRNWVEQLPTPGQAEIAKLKSDALALLDSPPGRQAAKMLETGMPPEPPAGATTDSEITAALAAINSSKSEEEIEPVVARVNDDVLARTLRSAKDQVAAFDAETKPANAAIDRLQSLLGRQIAWLKAQPEQATPDPMVAQGSKINRDLAAASLRYGAARYEVEARLNQAVASVYEIQVRKSNYSAERHHKRSLRFFFGMLAAQLGVIISTFAIAARQRNLLWVIAAAAGLVAVAFAVYVYVFV